MIQPDPYIKLVTVLGDSHRIQTIQDIRSEQGVTLLKPGQRIDSSQYEPLARHRLSQPLDCSLGIADRATAESLMSDAKRLLATESELLRAVDRRFIQKDLLTPIGTVPLEPPLAFKLTVYRECRSERYHHMLRVAIVALYIASRLRWLADEKQDLATAALFQNLGELHLDPALFSSQQPLSLAQHREIYSHPTIAYEFLRQFPRYHPQVSKTVHQHHERVDGSGYPNGLTGDSVARAARVLGAAELLTVIRLERKSISGGLFSTAEVLRFNSERFGTDIIMHLIEAAKRIDGTMDGVSGRGLVNKTTLQARMTLLNNILQGADAIDLSDDNEMAQFIVKQLKGLTDMAKRCGFDLHKPAKLMTIIGDEQRALCELDALVREMIFLVQSSAREALRRWVKDDLPEQGQEPLARWLWNVEMVLQSAGFRSE